MATLTTEYLEKILDKRFSDFARLMKKSFDEMGARTDAKFERLEAKMDYQFSLLVERCDNIEAQVKDLEQKMNFRFSTVDAELETIKRDLKIYSKRDKEDSDAFKTTVNKLQRRVETLESQVKKLKASQKQSAKI